MRQLPINEIPGGWPDEEDEAETPPADLLERLIQERSQQAVLLEKGLTFTTPIRSLLRYVSKNGQRTWLLKQPYLGTLDYLSAEYIDMDLSEARIKEEALPEARRLVHHNARRMARIVAIAWLNDRWGIKLLTGVVSTYLRWRLTPQTLYQLALIIQELSNHMDFINSIRLMAVATRTTTPVLMEQPANKPA